MIVVARGASRRVSPWAAGWAFELGGCIVMTSASIISRSCESDLTWLT